MKHREKKREGGERELFCMAKKEKKKKKKDRKIDINSKIMILL